MRSIIPLAILLLSPPTATAEADDSPPKTAREEHWLWSTAYAVPVETTSEQSGYFSIVEGKDGRIYIGTAKYGANAYLVEFDPATKQMKVVVDAQKEIGTTATGFAAQSKIRPHAEQRRHKRPDLLRHQAGLSQGGGEADRLSGRLPDGLRPEHWPDASLPDPDPPPGDHQHHSRRGPQDRLYLHLLRPAARRERVLSDPRPGDRPLSRPPGYTPYVRVPRRRSPRAGLPPDPRRRDRALRPPDRHPQTPQADDRRQGARGRLAPRRPGEPPDQLGGLPRPQDPLRRGHERQSALRL